MKKTLLSACVLLSLNLFSQAKDSLLIYTEVVSVENTTKDQLFVKARQWFNDAWKSSKDVLQITDKETGELSGKGIISSYYDYKPPMGAAVKPPVDYHVSISVFVKDGRYKYEFTSFRPIEGKAGGMEVLGTITTGETSPVKFAYTSQKKSDAMYKSLKMHLNERMLLMIASLKQAMLQQNSKLDF